MAMLFKKKNGHVIDDIGAYVKDWTDEHPNSEIYVGCDSQMEGDRINYATSICLCNVGKGTHIVTSKETASDARNIAMVTRLWSEVERAIQAAELIKDVDKNITIHVDYNSKKSEKSNQLYEAGIGYAKSLGYEAVGKPHAFAASRAADHECR